MTQVVSTSANDTSISLQLLSSIIANPLVFDQNGSGLYFQITGSNITVYTIGATGVTLEYATTALTSKQGAVWTLEFTTQYNTTVVLPQQSTLTSVSGTPSQLSTSNGSPVVVVAPGTWVIDYGLPIEVSTTSSTTNSSVSETSSASTSSATSSVSSTAFPISSTSASTGSSGTVAASSSASSSGLGPVVTSNSVTTNTSSASSSQSYLEAAALVVVAMVLLAATSMFVLRRRGAAPGPQASELRPDDVKVLDFISEKGGKVLEPEIRTRFALPKTSGWRQIKRLERLGYVKVTKIGSQNQIELLKRPQGAQSA